MFHLKALQSLTIAIGLLCSNYALADTVPQFSNYPATQSESPSRHRLIATPLTKNFKTAFAQAMRSPVDFAGHYVTTSWGCGTGCAAGAMVDVNTGKSYPLPSADIITRPDSRLLVAKQYSSDGVEETVEFYVWTGKQFKLIQTSRAH